MARRVKKSKAIELAKFGGTEELGTIKMHGYDHDTSTVEVQSKTNLQQDKGEGNYVIVRKFTFAMNALAFNEVKPTKQELFNYHLKGIETMLWRDGWKIFDKVQPQIKFDVPKMQYDIYVGAIPMAKYNTINAQARTLSEIANGT